jgi:hypothetical protein
VVGVGDDGVVQVLRGVSNKAQGETASSRMCSMSMGVSWCGPARRTELGARRVCSVDDGSGSAGQERER